MAYTMQDLNNKTIRFPEKANDNLTKVAQKFGRTKLKIFLQMVEYFYHTKKDPADLNDGALRNAVIKGNHQIASFLKAQEQLLLIPIKQDSERISHAQQKVLEWLSSDEIGHRQRMEKMLSNQSKLIEEISFLSRNHLTKIQNKEQMKHLFQEIFESYVIQRDGFSLMTSSKEKENVLAEARRKIKNL